MEKETKPKLGRVVVLQAAIVIATFFAAYFWLNLLLDTFAVSESKPGGEDLSVVVIMLAGVIATIVAFLLKGVGKAGPVGKVEAVGNVAGTASFVGTVAAIGFSSGNTLITLAGVVGFAMAAIVLVADDSATKDLEKFFSKGRLTLYFGAEFVLVLAPIVWLALMVSRPT